MTSMFSTILNFGVLGQLQRLHRIHIQYCLESESDITSIVYLHKKIHKKMDGYLKRNDMKAYYLSNQEIFESVKAAKEEAKCSIKILGMDTLLQKHNKYDDPPLPIFNEKITNDDEVDDEVSDEEHNEEDDDGEVINPCLADLTPKIQKT